MRTCGWCRTIGIFQGYYFFHHLGMNRNLRDQFKGHAHYERTAEFCDQFDNPAFDANAETLPMSEFEPMLRRVFAQPRNTIYTAVASSTSAASTTSATGATGATLAASA